MDFLEEFCLGHDWDGRLSWWKATSSIVLSIEWKQVYNQHFYIALDWQLDHWSCSWPGCESLMVSGWIKNQDPNQPQREMTSPSQSEVTTRVMTASDISDWQLYRYWDISQSILLMLSVFLGLGTLFHSSLLYFLPISFLQMQNPVCGKTA